MVFTSAPGRAFFKKSLCVVVLCVSSFYPVSCSDKPQQASYPQLTIANPSPLFPLVDPTAPQTAFDLLSERDVKSFGCTTKANCQLIRGRRALDGQMRTKVMKRIEQQGSDSLVADPENTTIYTPSLLVKKRGQRYEAIAALKNGDGTYDDRLWAVAGDVAYDAKGEVSGFTSKELHPLHLYGKTVRAGRSVAPSDTGAFVLQGTQTARHDQYVFVTSPAQDATKALVSFGNERNAADKLTLAGTINFGTYIMGRYQGVDSVKPLKGNRVRFTFNGGSRSAVADLNKCEVREYSRTWSRWARATVSPQNAKKQQQ